MPSPSQNGPAALIAVDWGTTRLRAWLVTATGRIVEGRESDEGIGRTEGRHEATFERIVAGWPQVATLMAGMIGSRQGWREAPYVPCPATARDVAAQVMRFRTSAGRAVAIVPGVRMAASARDGDVMRGEETQAIGLLSREPGGAGVAVFPGTHSKWMRFADGALAGFQTFISGDLFDLLARQSFLRHSVAESGAFAAEDFALGVRRTVDDGLPFAASLFSVRTRVLLGGVRPEDNRAYLSGLVIGGEIAAARTLGYLAAGVPVRIVASTGLAKAYGDALRLAGYEVTTVDGEALVLAGLMDIARATEMVR